MIAMPSKALLYRDFKSSGLMIVVVFLLLLAFQPPNVISASSGANYVFYVIVSAIMSALLFDKDRRPTHSTFVSSLPVTRNETIISKWLVSSYIIAISYFMRFVIVSCLNIATNRAETIGSGIFINTITEFFVFLFINAVILTVQSLNASMIGTFIAVVFLAAPLTLVDIITRTILNHSGGYLIPKFFEELHLVEISQTIYNLFCYQFNFVVDAESVQFVPLIQTNSFEINYVFVILRILIFIGMILGLFFVSTKVFNKNEFERNGDMVAIKGAERLYRILFSYLIGYFMNYIYFAVLIWPGRNFYMLDMLIVFCVIFPVPIYYLTGLIIKKYNARNV